MGYFAKAFRCCNIRGHTIASGSPLLCYHDVNRPTAFATIDFRSFPTSWLLPVQHERRHGTGTDKELWLSSTNRSEATRNSEEVSRADVSGGCENRTPSRFFWPISPAERSWRSWSGSRKSMDADSSPSSARDVGRHDSAASSRSDESTTDNRHT